MFKRLALVKMRNLEFIKDLFDILCILIRKKYLFYHRFIAAQWNFYDLDIKVTPIVLLLSAVRNRWNFQ